MGIIYRVEGKSPDSHDQLVSTNHYGWDKSELAGSYKSGKSSFNILVAFLTDEWYNISY